MNKESLLNTAGPYVIGLFEEYPVDKLIYHSLDHTRHVVYRAGEIARAEGLPQADCTTVVMAAWFHDTGHLNGGIENHEERSVEFMRRFMQEQGVEDAAWVQAVADCIMATRIPHDPQNLLQEVVCDADTYHFGTPDMRKTNKAIKQEFVLRGYTGLTRNWRRHTLAMLESHKFFTKYTNDTLGTGKEENLAWAQRKALEKEAAKPPRGGGADNGEAVIATPKAQKKNKDKEGGNGKNAASETEMESMLLAGNVIPAAERKLEAKQKNSLVARGIQTMLRLASENQVELSNLADGKANILISVNAIIISVILSVLIRRLEVDTYLTIPTIIFLASSVMTVVVAILATRPKLTEGNFTRQDILNRKTNLLFFGNFYKSTLDEYQWAMDRLMKDKDYIYGSLVKDIYFLGVVLGRKYKLIRLAYNIFMIGIIVSVLAFSLAVVFNNPENTINITNGKASPL